MDPPTPLRQRALFERVPHRLIGRECAALIQCRRQRILAECVAEQRKLAVETALLYRIRTTTESFIQRLGGTKQEGGVCRLTIEPGNPGEISQVFGNRRLTADRTDHQQAFAGQTSRSLG